MNYLKHPTLLIFSMICFSGFGQAGIVSVTQYDEILYFNCATHEDTVLLDLNTPYPDILIPGFEGSSDPYNNRYFFGAYTDLFSSSLRVFTYDLLSGSLTSSDAFSFEHIHYDPFENSILFRDSNYLKRYSLDSGAITTIGSLPDQTSTYLGQHYAYDFVNQQLFYNHPGAGDSAHFVVFDLNTGMVTNNIAFEGHVAPNMLVHDDGTDAYYGMINDGDIVSVNPLTGAYTFILNIPDWQSMLNEEMGMFDQLKGHYILPYLSTGGLSKIATIDVINQTIIANSLYPQSDYNQLFTALPAPVRVSGNELTTIHAEGYQWYINGIPQAGATQQSIQTSVDGDYYAKVTCAGGRTINSDTISVQALGLSDLNASESITVNPNPLHQTSTIDLSKLEGSAFHLNIYSATGELALQLEATDEENFQIEEQQLHPGMFFFLLTNESGLIGKGKFVVE